MSEEILYKAKNSMNEIGLALLYGVYIVGIVILIFFFTSKFLTELSFNSPLRWMPYLLILMVMWLIFTSIRNYFLNFIGLTKDGIIVKQNKDYKVVLYENIRLIKRYSTRHNSYTLIKKKNDENVFGPNIKDLNELVHQIRTIYPAFTNSEGIIQGFDEDITSSGFALLIILGGAVYSIDKIYHLDKNFLRTPLGLTSRIR